jgi:hypothetical protein
MSADSHMYERTFFKLPEGKEGDGKGEGGGETHTSGVYDTNLQYSYNDILIYG